MIACESSGRSSMNFLLHKNAPRRMLLTAVIQVPPAYNDWLWRKWKTSNFNETSSTRRRFHQNLSHCRHKQVNLWVRFTHTFRYSMSSMSKTSEVNCFCSNRGCELSYCFNHVRSCVTDDQKDIRILYAIWIKLLQTSRSV